MDIPSFKRNLSSVWISNVKKNWFSFVCILRETITFTLVGEIFFFFKSNEHLGKNYVSFCNYHTSKTKYLILVFGPLSPISGLEKLSTIVELVRQISFTNLRGLLRAAYFHKSLCFCVKSLNLRLNIYW